jgi:hypothetical protein
VIFAKIVYVGPRGAGSIVMLKRDDVGYDLDIQSCRFGSAKQFSTPSINYFVSVLLKETVEEKEVGE